MSDVVQLAKVAREQLAAALNALQNGVNVPDELMEVADPIAEAMSVFHRIERSGGTQLEGRTEALAHVRGALDSLQAIEATHPAVDAVMEAVAGALSKAHTLSRYKPPAPAPAAAPAPAPAAAPAPAPAAAPVPAPVASPAPAFAPVASPAPVFAPVSAPAPVFAPIPSAPSAAPIPRPPAGPAPTPAIQPQTVIPLGVPHSAPHPVPVAATAPQPIAAPQLIPVPDAGAAFSAFAPVGVSPTGVPRSQSDPGPSFSSSGPAFNPSPAQAPADGYPSAAAAYTPPVAYTPPAAYPAPQAAPAPLSAPEPAGGSAGQSGYPTIVVELGTRSASNFYKGLAGNDVLEHGGVFVATYKIPKIGSTVTLHVLMPGNYEFNATALVQWVREPRSDNTEPGFGARLTEIGAEGRQLVYRYTRNREPLFYDDL